MLERVELCLVSEPLADWSIFRNVEVEEAGPCLAS